MKAIGQGALAYYQAELYADQDMTATTKPYPGSTRGDGGGTGIGEVADGTTVGKKFSLVEYGEALANPPWSALKFEITMPFYCSMLLKLQYMKMNVKCLIK